MRKMSLNYKLAEGSSENIELENIRTTKSRLEQAVKEKAAELYDKYGVEAFKDNTDIGSYMAVSGLSYLNCNVSDAQDILRNSQEYQLFFYLAKRQNISDNKDIDLYVANVLFDFTRKSYSDFRRCFKQEEYGRGLTEGLLNETEALLLNPIQNPFGRAHQTYLLGEVEILRATMLLHQYKDSNPEVNEKVAEHYQNAIKFLEESLYHSRDIADVKRKLERAKRMTGLIKGKK